MLLVVAIGCTGKSRSLSGVRLISSGHAPPILRFQRYDRCFASTKDPTETFSVHPSPHFLRTHFLARCDRDQLSITHKIVFYFSVL
jgi:hypothetical protein